MQYKHDTETPNTKLVLSYFGSHHSIELAYYFTDIVKTHTINLNAEAPEGIRRINIPDTVTINLNEKLQHKIFRKSRKSRK
jgi:hypothetical protein